MWTGVVCPFLDLCICFSDSMIILVILWLLRWMFFREIFGNLNLDTRYIIILICVSSTKKIYKKIVKWQNKSEKNRRCAIVLSDFSVFFQIFLSVLPTYIFWVLCILHDVRVFKRTSAINAKAREQNI